MKTTCLVFPIYIYTSLFCSKPYEHPPLVLLNIPDLQANEDNLSRLSNPYIYLPLLQQEYPPLSSFYIQSGCPQVQRSLNQPQLHWQHRKRSHLREGRDVRHVSLGIASRSVVGSSTVTFRGFKELQEAFKDARRQFTDQERKEMYP